jgi:ribosomal protein L16 Arg81 hydroxylase
MATRATPTRTTPTRTPPSPAALARAVEPFEVERFLAEHWERQPLVVPRGEDGRFDDLLSTRDVERLITESGIRLPAFRLVKAGGTVSGYTTDLSWRPSPFTGVAEVHRVLEEFERGATIVLQGLHHNWLPLARYCRHLEAHLGHPVQANAYYTPAGSQGLPVHHDTHEVVSLQVSGSKRWLVYEPVLELPLKNQRYRSALGEPGEPVLDVTLRAGDTLYLPRGWLHQALTSDDDSLHITVGINVRRWVDEARVELDAAEGELAFRQTIDAEEPPELPTLDADEVRARARARFVDTRRPILDGQLSELRALAALTADDELERRDTVIADLDGATLAFEGRTLRFPHRVEQELVFLVTTEAPFRASELPGELDEPGRLVLVRRLVREGFLRRTASAG